MGCSFSEITLSNQMISRTMGRNNPIYGRFRQEHHLDKQLTPQETPTLLGLFRPTSGIKPNINYIMKHLLKHIILPNYEDASAIPSFRQGSPESRLQGCPQSPRRPWSLGSGDPCRNDDVLGLAEKSS